MLQFFISLNFSASITAEMRVGSSPLCRVAQGVQQNLVCHFWTFIQVSTNFESLHYFLRIKSIEKRLNRPHSAGRIWPMASAFQAWWPAERGALACWHGSAHPGRPAHAVPPHSGHTRGRRHRSRGPSMARSCARAPRLSGGCARQEERRRGSPRAAIDCEAEWWLGVAARGGVLAIGRVGSDTG
jgi:hypothetical protein